MRGLTRQPQPCHAHVRYLRRCGSGSPASGQPSASRSRHRIMQTSSSQTTGEAHGGLQHTWSAYGSASGCWSSHSCGQHSADFWWRPDRQVTPAHIAARVLAAARDRMRRDWLWVGSDLALWRCQTSRIRTQPLAQRETAPLPECPPLMSFLDVTHVVLRRERAGVRGKIDPRIEKVRGHRLAPGVRLVCVPPIQTC